MTTRPITLADDADLRLSMLAMRRAARRAREIARATRTCLVLAEEDGSVARISPEELDRMEAQERLTGTSAVETQMDVAGDETHADQ